MLFSAVKGVLERYGVEGVNDINALYLAEERGIQANIMPTPEDDAETIRVDHVDVYIRGKQDKMSKQTYLAGTVYQDGRKRLVQIDEADIEVRLDKHMLFLRYPDRPGVIGAVGTILGGEEINIENMEVRILKKVGRAHMVVGTETAVPDRVVKRLLADDKLKHQDTRIYRVDLVD